MEILLSFLGISVLASIWGGIYTEKSKWYKKIIFPLILIVLTIFCTSSLNRESPGLLILAGLFFMCLIANVITQIISFLVLRFKKSNKVNHINENLQ